MKNLLVSGCSFTQYHYPTWSYWVGQKFDNYVNLGRAGSGHLYSYTQIIDYFKYTPNIDPKEYTVIVEWSSLIRHDIRKEDGDWKTYGQITNTPIFDEEYISKYYSLIGSTCNLVHYIDSLITLSEKLGFKLYMLYMFEPWIGDNYGEPTLCCRPNIDLLTPQIKNWKKSKYYNSMYQISQTDLFISPSIQSFILDDPKLKQEKAHWHYHDGKGDKSWNVDHHPTANQHLNYGLYVLDKLGINLPLEEKIQWENFTKKLSKILYSKEGVAKFWKFFKATPNIYFHPPSLEELKQKINPIFNSIP